MDFSFINFRMKKNIICKLAVSASKFIPLVQKQINNTIYNTFFGVLDLLLILLTFRIFKIKMLY